MAEIRLGRALKGGAVFAALLSLALLQVPHGCSRVYPESSAPIYEGQAQNSEWAVECVLCLASGSKVSEPASWMPLYILDLRETATIASAQTLFVFESLQCGGPRSPPESA